jgi:general secretion pathway protein G
MRRKKRRTGFTLIEIMVVIVIIGLLATLVAANLDGIGRDSREKATQANIQTIKMAVAHYELDNGRLPKTLEALVNGSKHYLDREIVPPDAWGNAFRYYRKGDLVKIRSSGVDGIFNTEDDVLNE